MVGGGGIGGAGPGCGVGGGWRGHLWVLAQLCDPARVQCIKMSRCCVRLMCPAQKPDVDAAGLSLSDAPRHLHRPTPPTHVPPFPQRPTHRSLPAPRCRDGITPVCMQRYPPPHPPTHPFTSPLAPLQGRHRAGVTALRPSSSLVHRSHLALQGRHRARARGAAAAAGAAAGRAAGDGGQAEAGG